MLKYPIVKSELTSDEWIAANNEASTGMDAPLHYEDIQLGARWESPSRTMTETDIVSFACLTGDFNRLHVDHQYAQETPFGRPIAHGLLGLAWVAGLGSNHPCPETVALVGIREWRFLKPVYIGDTLHVVTEVVGKQAKGRRAGQVTWKRSLVNHDGEIVQEGYIETLVAMHRVATSKRDTAEVDALPVTRDEDYTPVLVRVDSSHEQAGEPTESKRRSEQQRRNP
jgi:acyl dehydratase